MNVQHGFENCGFKSIQICVDKASSGCAPEKYLLSQVRFRSLSPVFSDRALDLRSIKVFQDSLTFLITISFTVVGLADHLVGVLKPYAVMTGFQPCN